MDRYIKIADEADVIVNGYAFTKSGSNVRVLNLNASGKATVLNNAGEVLETSMDDIEINIILGYYLQNRKYMEE